MPPDKPRRSTWLPFTLLATAALLTIASSPTVAAAAPPSDPAFIREPGRCAMRDTCGSKSIFSGQLPCPDNGLAKANDDAIFLATLADVCGPDFPTTTCCTQGQLEVLSNSLAQAEPLIATCPACRSNFRHFYCSFTCSPDQSLFMAVTETQKLTSGGVTKDAVKSVDVDIAPSFGEGFFNSCKDVKFGATNGYAMDLIGGGAKSYLPFLRYMGTERALGSPFQINFPAPSPSFSLSPPPQQHTFDNSTIVPFHDTPLSCSSAALDARCACPDCPSVCAILPPVSSPEEIEAHRCRVGKMSCFSFALTIVYGVLLTTALVTLALTEAWSSRGCKSSGGEDDTGAWTRLRHRLSFARWSPTSPSASGYDRLPLEDPLLAASDYDESPVQIGSVPSARSGSGNRSTNGSLVGATALGHALDADSPQTSLSSSSRRANRAGFDPSTSSSDVSTNPFLQPRTYQLNTSLSNFFYRLGFFCASKPYLTLALGLSLCGLVNVGWKSFAIERDPVRLWVAKGSPAELAKEAFDEAFGPFYRTQQVFLSVAPPASTHSASDQTLDSLVASPSTPKWAPVDEPVLSFATLEWWSSIETRIRSLTSSPNNYTLPDVCFSPSTSPSPPPTTDACVVQSALGYFGGTLEGVSESTWADQLNQCATTPAACLAPFGQPLSPKLVLGGIPTSSSPDDDLVQADQARALVVTYVLNNSLNSSEIARAEEWEETLEKFIQDVVVLEARERGLQLAWSTGVSLEEELSASANTDVLIVVLSYVFMFLYVAINLGSSGAGLLKMLGRAILFLFSSVVGLFGRSSETAGGRPRSSSVGSLSAIGAYAKRQILVESKFLLGLWGIIIVLLSVSTSVALCSAFGIKVTLVIAEVIPFLVLAIGVDNVFILSHELDQQNARAYSSALRHGTSTFAGLNGNDDPLGQLDDEEAEGLPSAEERVARALGRMGPSILLSASCETVAFALGALVGMPAVRNFAVYAAGAVVVNALLQVTVFVSAMAIDLKRIESNRIDCFPCFKLRAASSVDIGASVSEGYIARFIRTVYAPSLLLKPVKYFVMVLFSGIFVLSWIGARHITLGLDQRLALPSSSYLVDYFNAVDTFLDVGPPVYFVVKDLNMSSLDNVKSVCGRFSTCDEYSVANVLEAERKRPDSSFIAEPPAVWIDDFFQWLNPLLEDCCRVKKRNSTEFCSPDDPEGMCRPCFEDREPPWSITLEGLPEGPEFQSLLAHWLESPTDESCPLGGKAGYSTALALRKDNSVELSHFRTYHTPLKTQDDFINALAAANRVAQDLSKRIGAEVFPYSLPYVFFASYAHIWGTTREVLFFALAAVFCTTSIVLGSWRTGSVVVLTVFLTVVNVLGVMGVWSISLNPISLVNLVVSVGIAVEFCSHIARAFMGALGGGLPFQHPAGQKDRDERAWTALVDVGSSVVSGITLTKLIGLSVLGLTRSKLLQIYYARMFCALIVSSALHGLVFLPVALSFWGGQGYALTADDGDGSWIASAVDSRYRHENRGFQHDDDNDSDDSDFF